MKTKFIQAAVQVVNNIAELLSTNIFDWLAALRDTRTDILYSTTATTVAKAKVT